MRSHVCILAALAALALLAGCNTSPQAREARGLKRGAKFLAKGDYSRAVLELKNAIQAVPNDAEPYYQIGLAYLGLQDTRDAAASFRRATDLNPKHAGAQLKLAEMLGASRDKSLVEEAAKRLETILAIAPGNNEANDTLALAEWELGRPDDAAARLEESLKRSPADLRASVDLANMKLRASDRAGAEAVLRKAVASSPQSGQAALALARFYWITGQTEKAEIEVKRDLALDPRNGPALEGLAAMQVAGHRMEEAEETYKRLAALPEKQYKHLHAVFLFQQGKRDLGLAELAKLAGQDPGDREARTRLLAAYVSMGKIAEARQLLANALKKNPKDADALFEQAELYLRNGNARGAESDLKQVLHFKPDSAQVHFALAEVYRAERATETQRQELNEALRLDPAMLPARLALAWNFIASNHAQAGLEVLAQTPPQQKNTLAVVVARNWALYAAGNLKEMRIGVDQALHAGRHPELVLQDAVLRMADGDYVGARVAAEEVLGNNPEIIGAAQILADSYFAQKQPEKAIQRIAELVGQRPKSARLQVLLAKYYLADGKRSEARQAYEAAKAAEPDSIEADLDLARMDYGEKRMEEARRRLTNILNADPRNVSALLMLASLEAETGSRDSAIAKYRAVLDIDDRNVFALNDLAWNLAADHPDEALKYAEQAGEIAPNSPNVEDTLGWIYYRKGIYRTAIDYLKNAVAKETTPRREFHLAMSYLKAGDSALGQKTLSAALKEDPNLVKTERGW